MTHREDVLSQVGLAALLDTTCLQIGLLDDELLHDIALWAPAVPDGPNDLLASHPSVMAMVDAAIDSARPQVRATVAARPDLDPVHYAMLAADDHHAVRARVASNHAAPQAVVLRLSHDPEPDVQVEAEAELCRRAHPSAA